LVERGHVAQLLLSQDVFLKSLLRSHGGPGYGHVLQYFVPRLLAAGLDAGTVELLMVANPRALFAGARPTATTI
jgi:phosphotriesterase-related protein